MASVQLLYQCQWSQTRMCSLSQTTLQCKQFCVSRWACLNMATIQTKSASLNLIGQKCQGSTKKKIALPCKTRKIPLPKGSARYALSSTDSSVNAWLNKKGKSRTELPTKQTFWLVARQKSRQRNKNRQHIVLACRKRKNSWKN